MKHRRAKPRIPFTGLLLLLLGVGVSTSGYGLPNDEEWMHALQHAIGQTEKYDIEKLNRIDRLQGQLAGSPKEALYDLYLAIYEEYASFKCDPAHAYAKNWKGLPCNRPIPAGRPTPG